MRLLAKLLLWLAAALAVLVAVIVVNTLRFPVAPVSSATATSLAIDIDKSAARLADAIRIKTVSTSNPQDRDMAAFGAFMSWLETAYPGFHASTRRTVINNHSLLYVWGPESPSEKPVLLTGHYDVVPADEGSQGGWDEPPFSGAIKDGFVWGRGALDDKGAIIAMLEAAELLIAQGFKPSRQIHFAFGHDEEIGGLEGAAKVAAHLKDAGVTYEWSLDEGSMVLDGILPGVDPRIASINVAEKGNMTVDLAASAPGGHSSLPPPETAVGNLATAIDRLVKSPVPGGLTGSTADFFNAIAGHMPFVQRVLFANQWLFAPILENVLSGSAATNAMLRTTTAPTMLSGSVKENVLPSEATGTVNFRLHPRDTVEGVVGHIHSAIKNEAIDVRVRPGAVPASPVSSATAKGFGQIADAARSVFDNIIVVPGLTIAITDTRHWSTVSVNSYRFSPFVFRSDDIPRLHGKNERISIDNLKYGITFYAELMKVAASS